MHTRAGQPPPRVLVVEDDAAIRRFIALALEGLPVELVLCESVAAALAALRVAPAALVITDLTLPGESGSSLLQALVCEPVLRGGARLAVFSAAVDTHVRAQLAALDVWRVLPKPVPLAVLEACVVEGLQGLDAGREADQDTPSPPAPDAPTQGRLAGAVAPQAIAEHFGGDEALYTAYRASCAHQFPADVAAGDAACAAGDLGALMHLAHSLKTVLTLLGHADASRLAADLERRANARDAHAAVAHWQRLRGQLLALASLPC